MLQRILFGLKDPLNFLYSSIKTSLGGVPIAKPIRPPSAMPVKSNIEPANLGANPPKFLGDVGGVVGSEGTFAKQYAGGLGPKHGSSGPASSFGLGV